MSSILVAYRILIERIFRSHLPGGPEGVIQVSTYPGYMNSDKVIQRYALQSPCVVLAPMGVPSISNFGGNATADLTYAAFILTKTRAASDRNDLALGILENIIRFLPFIASEMEGLPFKTPERIHAENYNTQETDDMSLCFWCVKWTQRVLFDLNIYNILDDFLRLHADYDLNENEAIESEQLIEVPGP